MSLQSWKFRTLFLPRSASDRRVSVDIAGRKMYSAVALKAHRLKARVGDAVSHLAVRNGCSARCLGDLLGRCKIDGHVENADGETVLDVALNVGAPEDVVACVERWLASPEALAELCESPTRSRKVRPFVTKAAEKGFAAAAPGEAAPRPATASLRRPASRSGLSAKALAARNDGDRPRTAPKAPRDRRRFPVPVAESPLAPLAPINYEQRAAQGEQERRERRAGERALLLVRIVLRRGDVVRRRRGGRRTLGELHRCERDGAQIDSGCVLRATRSSSETAPRSKRAATDWADDAL